MVKVPTADTTGKVFAFEYLANDGVSVDLGLHFERTTHAGSPYNGWARLWTTYRNKKIKYEDFLVLKKLRKIRDLGANITGWNLEEFQRGVASTLDLEG